MAAHKMAGRAYRKEEKRAAKLAKVIPQMTAKAQGRKLTQTSKHRAQRLALHARVSF
jgi:hypothetical protein